jgi:hypothetical protein
MKDDDLACPSCGGQDIEIAVFQEPPYFVGMECSCGWTCEGEGIDWRAQLVPYEGDSTEARTTRSGRRRGGLWTPEAPGPGEPPGW